MRDEEIVEDVRGTAATVQIWFRDKAASRQPHGQTKARERVSGRVCDDVYQS
jgi:hypothetical protein